jgi:uncharacterized membrane protein YfcA
MNTSFVALLITGFAIGTVSGLLGIGGAVILVPTLMFVFKFPQAQAQGTSLGALVPPIGIFAALQYWRNGYLDVKVAAIIALGFVFGALAGATAVPYVPQVWLKRAFATFLAFGAAQMMFGDPSRRMGSILPGVIASGLLWLWYGVRRLFDRNAPPPRPPTPKPPGDEYYI